MKNIFFIQFSESSLAHTHTELTHVFLRVYLDASISAKIHFNNVMYTLVAHLLMLESHEKLHLEA